MFKQRVSVTMKEIENEFRNCIDKELKEMLFDKKGNLTISCGIFLVSLGITLIQEYLKKIGGINKKCK